MNIKETAAMRVLSARRELTIPQVRLVGAELTGEIDQEVERSGMEIAGAWVFVAQNLPKDGKTPFLLRICRPVRFDASYTGPFELTELEPIMVASVIHQGPLRTLFTQGYGPLVREIENSRYAFSGESREIYHHWAGEIGRYHQIEIQFGLAY